jgi:thiamine-phosphate pyrophosphorylase
LDRKAVLPREGSQGWRREEMPLSLDVFRLCLVADSEAAGERDILQLVKESILGGVTMVQLRSKIWSTKKFLETGHQLSRLLKLKRIPLVINDRADIALACDSDGVHLGQEDLPMETARKLVGNSRIIGISASSVLEAVQAEGGGADYIGVGPIFPTLSKKDLKPKSLLGIQGLRRIKEKTNIPVLAIGGIDAARARQVIETGADGIAVISAILGARDPRRAAAELVEAMRI